MSGRFGERPSLARRIDNAQAAQIASYRKAITSTKGKVKRREDKLWDIRAEIGTLKGEIRHLQDMIESLGGKVKR